MKYKVYDDNKEWVEFDDAQKAVMYAKDNLLDGEFVYHRNKGEDWHTCLLYTSPSPRDRTRSRMPSSA